MPGTLYLIPADLGAGDAVRVLSPSALERLSCLTRFIVENHKSARRFLKDARYPRPLQTVELQTLDEHTPAADLPRLLAPLIDGHDCGLLSEAGCPAVADPGAALVRLAHARGIRVVPLVGPSALLLALMASGLNGQRFQFHGYLPVETGRRSARLRELERQSAREGLTQIFIEAPYRNAALLHDILQTCGKETLLCLAIDITLPTESIRTQSIADWRSETPNLNRRPAVFLLYCGT